MPRATSIEAGDKAGVASMKTARGGALADFNLDGWIDLVVVNRWESAQLWRNTGSGSANWLGLALAQPAPNRDGVGSWVEVRCGEHVQRREITVGGGHAGGQIGLVAFRALGRQDHAEVRVIWPDGTEGPWQTSDGERLLHSRTRCQPPGLDAALRVRCRPLIAGDRFCVSAPGQTGGLPRTARAIIATMNRTMKTKKRICAIDAEAPAIPPKSERRRDQRDDQKGQCPTQHDYSPLNSALSAPDIAQTPDGPSGSRAARCTMRAFRNLGAARAFPRTSSRNEAMEMTDDPLQPRHRCL